MALATAGGTRPIDPRGSATPTARCADGLAHFDWRKIFRPRTLRLFRRLVAGRPRCCSTRLLTRDRLEVNVLHDRNPHFVDAVRRLDPQRLHRQAAQHDPRAAHHHRHAAGPAGRGDERRRPRPARRSLLRHQRRARPAEDASRSSCAQPAPMSPAPSQSFRFVVEDKSSFETDSYDASFEAPEMP